MRQVNKDLLPVVWPSKVEKGYGYRELLDKYQSLPKMALKVTGTLLTGFVPTDSDGKLHLDGILSSAVLASHPCTAKYPKGAAIIPLPLDMLWVSDNGWPLWASSDLTPLERYESAELWHKRYPTHRADLGVKMSANTSAGRWREYRVPVGALSPTTIAAVCIGNKDEIERLLSYVTHVGKKGSAGYGRVVWDVSQYEGGDVADLIHQNKDLPLDYAIERNLRGTPMPTQGWTPPYWFAPNWSLCFKVAP